MYETFAVDGLVDIMVKLVTVLQSFALKSTSIRYRDTIWSDIPDKIEAHPALT